MSGKLKNNKHEKFCHEYVVDFNATQAALRTGYSQNVNTARTKGSELLTNHDILTRVKELLKEKCDRLCLTADNVLVKAINVHERCTQAYPVMAFNFNTKQMEPTGEYQFDSKGALKALEIIARLQGLFDDKLKIGLTTDTAELLAGARKRMDAVKDE